MELSLCIYTVLPCSQALLRGPLREHPTTTQAPFASPSHIFAQLIPNTRTAVCGFTLFFSQLAYPAPSTHHLLCLTGGFPLLLPPPQPCLPALLRFRNLQSRAPKASPRPAPSSLVGAVPVPTSSASGYQILFTSSLTPLGHVLIFCFAKHKPGSEDQQ